MSEWDGSQEDKGIVVSLLAIALHFRLREERIHGNPIGNLNIEQLEMNARAVSEPLPEGLLEEFLAQGF